MGHAVFVTSHRSHHNHRAGERYHFAKTYLSSVLTTVGDWVVLYEPKTSGTRGYYAFQRVARIEPDLERPNHFYAIFDDLIRFDRSLPRLRPNSTPYETGLPQRGGSNLKAVREVSPAVMRSLFTAGIAPAHKFFGAQKMGLKDYISSTITTPETAFSAPLI